MRPCWVLYCTIRTRISDFVASCLFSDSGMDRIGRCLPYLRYVVTWVEFEGSELHGGRRGRGSPGGGGWGCW